MEKPAGETQRRPNQNKQIFTTAKMLPLILINRLWQRVRCQPEAQRLPASRTFLNEYHVVRVSICVHKRKEQLAAIVGIRAVINQFEVQAKARFIFCI